MEEKYKVMGIMGLIALRKSELFYKVVNELSKDRQISEDDKEKIKKYVSEMENELFLSKDERQNRRINSKLKLKDIDLDIQKVIKNIKL
jgi:uncharacterized protein YpuA (DUF1002 family)